MNKPPKSDYVIGYGKPPQQTRFKPGTSGNPKGRPKGSQNLNAMLHNVFNAKVEVTDAKGRKRMMPKVEAVATQLVNRAVKGDHRAAREVLSLAPLVEHVRSTEKVSADNARQELLAKLLQIKERLQEKSE